MSMEHIVKIKKKINDAYKVKMPRRSSEKIGSFNF